MITTKKIISLPRLIKKTQAVFNNYIRMRDRDKGCVSCPGGKVEHASHFFSAGKYSALRFLEDNVHGSCLQCNYFLRGNPLPYRQTLLHRIGDQRLAILESTATRHRQKKWSRVELEEVIKMYKSKIKELA